MTLRKLFGRLRGIGSLQIQSPPSSQRSWRPRAQQLWWVLPRCTSLCPRMESKEISRKNGSGGACELQGPGLWSAVGRRSRRALRHLMPSHAFSCMMIHASRLHLLRLQQALRAFGGLEGLDQRRLSLAGPARSLRLRSDWPTLHHTGGFSHFRLPLAPGVGEVRHDGSCFAFTLELQKRSEATWRGPQRACCAPPLRRTLPWCMSFWSWLQTLELWTQTLFFFQVLVMFEMHFIHGMMFFIGKTFGPGSLQAKHSTSGVPAPWKESEATFSQVQHLCELHFNTSQRAEPRDRRGRLAWPGPDDLSASGTAHQKFPISGLREHWKGWKGKDMKNGRKWTKF